MQVAKHDSDQLFDSLANGRRRAAVALLDEYPDGISLRELADKIALHEVSDRAPPDDVETAKQRVYISLYQCHIPKLDDYDVVDSVKEGSGQGGHVVEQGVHFDRALQTLRAAEGTRSGSIRARVRELLR